MAFRKLKKDWEELAGLDTYHAILANPQAKFGKWDLDQFFQTGETEIARVIDTAHELGYPSAWDLAMDFGCGVGRLTRPLARRFHKCCGIDISESMISQARELNQEISGCEFILSTQNDLSIFPNEHFDMIYTRYVLQHIPAKAVIKTYLSELLRTTKKGGLLVFQLPCYLPPVHRLQLRRRAYGILRLFKINERLLYEKLGLDPVVSNYLPEREVTDLLTANGGVCLHIQKGSEVRESVNSRTYYVTK